MARTTGSVTSIAACAGERRRQNRILEQSMNFKTEIIKGLVARALPSAVSPLKIQINWRVLEA